MATDINLEERSTWEEAELLLNVITHDPAVPPPDPSQESSADQIVEDAELLLNVITHNPAAPPPDPSQESSADQIFVAAEPDPSLLQPAALQVRYLPRFWPFILAAHCPTTSDQPYSNYLYGSHRHRKRQRQS
jgi:hypothetical protein